MTLIRALPGSGKTWVAKHYTGFVDGDAIVLEVLGLAGSDANALLRDSQYARLQVRRAFTRFSATAVVLSSLSEPFTGVAPLITVGYAPQQYLRHLRLARRYDLLECVNHERLISWAQEMANTASTSPYHELAPGTYLASLFRHFT